jgi:peptidoglycan/xylan/chitin deacetylase (PgdA/CDA1 family)
MRMSYRSVSRQSPIGAKRRLKAALAKSYARFLARAPGKDRRRERVVILCYHSVHPGKVFASASPAQFDAHLRWLKANCEIIRLCDALETAKGSSAAGRPRVALTFDDGYADNFEYAFPLLLEHELTATFFLTAGLLERDRAVVERLQALRKTGYEDIRPLDWSEVREMRRGKMDLGSHTYSHPNLMRLGEAGAASELRNSKDIIEGRLGEAIHSLAYPFGMMRRHVNRATMAIAAEAGYQYAATVAFRPLNGHDDAMALPRFLVTRDDVEMLAGKVTGAWDFLGWWHEKAPLWLMDLVSGKASRV